MPVLVQAAIHIIKRESFIISYPKYIPVQNKTIYASMLPGKQDVREVTHKCLGLFVAHLGRDRRPEILPAVGTGRVLAFSIEVCRLTHGRCRREGGREGGGRGGGRGIHLLLAVVIATRSFRDGVPFLLLFGSTPTIGR